ncbi:hypothetical protein [Rhizobium glycinendophyticum]|uniref:Uncharacterized protein n=1 Tax=Rhizobium glycinendophyticum TaxID=2589807 RepID=A0A504U8B4_9HYPH|nr:hypothetical protein [Rhizobium glycinendophyticum]TPP11398.1 hypothetical protein FJQ55_11490 [Rhizobium glycinendophyticum]
MTTGLRIDNAMVAEALHKVLRSRTFARSERLRCFLKFVVEMEQLGLAHQLKGYTIGIDVFSRGEGFDPGTDPLVRVQAGKLRKLLNLFYAEEGREEPLRIRIPLGGYVPVYELAGASRATKDEGADGDLLPDLNTLTRRTRIDPTGPVQGLPKLFFAPPTNVSDGSSVFLNAIRLWQNRLWAVCIAPIGEGPLVKGGLADPLHFELEADLKDNTALRVSLRHLRTGTELLDDARTIPVSDDILKLGAAANEFAGANLTIPGRIYQFCHANGLSTSAMLCLDATYRYSLDRSDAAYLRALRHQQQWPGLDKNRDVIAEIPHLLALTCAHS